MMKERFFISLVKYGKTLILGVLFFVTFLLGLSGGAIEVRAGDFPAYCGTDYYYLANGTLYKKVKVSENRLGVADPGTFRCLSGTKTVFMGTTTVATFDGYWNNGNTIYKSINGAVNSHSLGSGSTATLIDSFGGDGYYNCSSSICKSTAGSVNSNSLGSGSTATLKCLAGTKTVFMGTTTVSTFDCYWNGSTGNSIYKSINGAVNSHSLGSGSTETLIDSDGDAYYNTNTAVHKSLAGSVNADHFLFGSTATAVSCDGDAYFDDGGRVSKGINGDVRTHTLDSGSTGTMVGCNGEVYWSRSSASYDSIYKSIPNNVRSERVGTGYITSLKCCDDGGAEFRNSSGSSWTKSRYGTLNSVWYNTTNYKQTCFNDTTESCSLKSCIGPDGTKIRSGESKTYYSSNSAACGKTCPFEERLCTNGKLGGTDTYIYPTCTVDPSYTLTVNKIGGGLAYSWVTGAGKYCPGKIANAIADTDPVNAVFNYWGSDCPNSVGNICKVTMDANKTITAAFKRVFPLTVIKAGDGGGKVVSTSTPISSLNLAEINCGGVCSASYISDTSVVLTANPWANSIFGFWTDCPLASGNTCTVSMTASTTVTATFKIAIPLAVSKLGTGTGVITSDLAGINCGDECSAAYKSGKTVVLTATPDSGSVFTRWSNGCDSKLGNTCTVLMDVAKSATSTFTAITTPNASLAVIDCSSNTIKLSWPAVATTTYYKIYKNDGFVASTTATSTQITAVSPTDYFQVTRVSLGAESLLANSTILRVMPLGSDVGPTPPTVDDAFNLRSYISSTTKPNIFAQFYEDGPFVLGQEYHLQSNVNVTDVTKYLKLDYYYQEDGGTWIKDGGTFGPAYGSLSNIFSTLFTAKDYKKIYYYAEAYPFCIGAYKNLSSWQAGYLGYDLRSPISCGSANGMDVESIPQGTDACPTGTNYTFTKDDGPWDWTCSDGVATSSPCHADVLDPLDPSLTCSVAMTPYVNPVMINTNTIWKATPNTCPVCNIDWNVVDANGTTTSSVATTTLNQTFTTIGEKQVVARVASTTDHVYGPACSATTSVTRTGGTIIER
jgi:hypothetical protein